MHSFQLLKGERLCVHKFQLTTSECELEIREWSMGEEISSLSRDCHGKSLRVMSNHNNVLHAQCENPMGSASNILSDKCKEPVIISSHT